MPNHGEMGWVGWWGKDCIYRDNLLDLKGNPESTAVVMYCHCCALYCLPHGYSFICPVVCPLLCWLPGIEYYDFIIYFFSYFFLRIDKVVASCWGHAI